MSALSSVSCPAALVPAAAAHLVKQPNLTLSPEQGLPREHLCKDAAHAPHVDARAVAADSKQQLRCPVPQCHHLVCVGFEGRQETACQPKVGHLDIVVACIHQDVLWLQVAVHDAVHVGMVHSQQDLPQE